MEVKIPKEIREYRESIFFGLSTRQFICSLLALGAAVGLYFLFDPLVGIESVGWICILGAAPFAVCGFFTYHGMTAEQTLWAWVKSQILMPRRLVFRSDSLYYQALQPAIEQGKKPLRKMKKRGGNKPAGEKIPAPKPAKEDAYH
ncbi:PrgI family protein [Ruthenibacterium lactatiformans]|uniref:PrgI family protein n=1 Tax=Ruthenibacterium lactatiformans TaxID=1550024 RepID=UPI0022E44AEC|nr:PrgI family protein [Ruthenibacterium lactatiformans]